MERRGGKTCVVYIDNIKTAVHGSGEEPLAVEDFEGLVAQLSVCEKQGKGRAWEGLGFKPHTPCLCLPAPRASIDGTSIDDTTILESRLGRAVGGGTFGLEEDLEDDLPAKFDRNAQQQGLAVCHAEGGGHLPRRRYL